eukprot:TRINITY_DN914_c0_g1_i1.p1 TRINITY_DN914_c0_g1~~TRINITY_DN914_c0_g1_i1.p1  ORF type:complete len:311 (-),score=65.85 TRINITY_DN914_c0_g1_i1:54-986(-)
MSEAPKTEAKQEKKDFKRKTNFWRDLAVGGTSGAIAKTLVAPLERVKILLQVQEGFKGIGDCFVQTYKNEGLRSFWRGNFVNVIRYFPTQALNFGFKDTYRNWFCPFDPKTQFWPFFFGSLASGGAAGASSLMIVYPLDFARTRLMADMKKSSGEAREFNGLADCLKKIYASDGAVGWYRGFGVSVIGIIAYRACYFGIYDTGKQLLFKDSRNTNFFLLWAFAQFNVLFSSTVSYPLDTIRRRLMMQSGKGTKEFTGTVSCAKYIIKNEGLKSMFRGCLSNIYRGTGAALVLVFYDKIQKYLFKNQLAQN